MSKKKNKTTKKQGKKVENKKPEVKTLTYQQQVTTLGKQLNTYKVQHVWPKVKELEGRVQFYGMGGSGIAGDLVNNYLSHLGINGLLEVSKDFYRQTDGLKPGPAIFSSYSGGTAETVTQANNYRGNMAVAITTGGDLLNLAKERQWGLIRLPKNYQPRAALGYSFSTLLSLLLAHKNVKPLTQHISKDLAKANQHLNNLIQTNKLDVRATNIAEKLKGKLVGVYSSTTISGINYRWRGQIQENADQFAFGGFFPEITHNHVNGFSIPSNLPANVAVVILKWKADSPLLLEKQNKLAGILRSKGFTVVEISTDEPNLLPAMMELIYLADTVSMKMAENNEVNPENIDLIQSLKL